MPPDPVATRLFARAKWLPLAVVLASLLSAFPMPIRAAADLSELEIAEQAYRAGDYERARTLLALLAERGNANAQFRLAQLTESGKGHKGDDAQARRLYTLAARGGHADAMVSLARMQLSGRGGAIDQSTARGWLRSAIAEGNVEAEAVLAASLLEANGSEIPEQQVKEGIAHYLSAAAKGFTDAYDALAKIYGEGKLVPVDMAKSTYFLRKSAESGDPWAMNDYAERLRAGAGEPADPQRAREWYARAAQLGNAEAQYQLALLIADDPKGDPATVNSLLAAAAPRLKWAASELAYRLSEGVGGIRDLKEADRLYTGLAGQGVRGAHLWLAEAREKGLVGDKNPKEALSHYLQAASIQEESWLSERIASYFEKGLGTPVDMAKAAQWHGRAAEAGSIDAAAWLADAYDAGRGVPANPAKAAAWARRAAEGGDAWSMAAYASALESGRGVQQDVRAALTWYEKAAAAGASEAELEVGRILSDEDLGMLDRKGAAQWFEKAAARGDARGELAYGRLLLFGLGVDPDQARAIKLITSAAQKNLAEAQSTLASLYLHGAAAPRDEERAYYWWSMAAGNGDRLAKLRAAELSAELPQESRKRVEQSVSEAKLRISKTDPRVVGKPAGPEHD